MVLLLQPKLEQLGFLEGEGRGVKKERRRAEKQGRFFGLPLSKKKVNIKLERLHYHSTCLMPISNLVVQ